MLFGTPPLVGLSHSAVNNFPACSLRFGIPLFALSGFFSPPSSSKLGAPVASLAPRAAGGGLGVLRRGQDPKPPAMGVGLGVCHPFLLRGERAVGAVVGGSATMSPTPHHLTMGGLRCWHRGGVRLVSPIALPGCRALPGPRQPPLPVMSPQECPYGDRGTGPPLEWGHLAAAGCTGGPHHRTPPTEV